MAVDPHRVIPRDGEGAAAGSQRGRLVALAATALLGAGLAATALVMGTRLDPGRSGAHRVRWIGPDGQGVPREPDPYFDGCDMADIGLSTLAHAGKVWVTCEERAEYPQGALGRIDPVQKLGRVSWPFPEGLAFGGRTEGLFPIDDDRLGFAYRAGNVNGRTAVGIAGPDGWVLRPEPLNDSDKTRLLGGAFVNGGLEVAFLPGGEGVEAWRAIPRLVRFDEKGRTEVRPFPDRQALCGEIPDALCIATRAIRREGDPAWWFVLAGLGVSGTGQRAALVSTDGRRTTTDVPTLAMWHEDVDNGVNGLTSGLFQTSAIRPDGTAVRIGEPPPGWQSSPGSRHYSAAGAGIARTAVWYQGEPRLAFARMVGERFVELVSAEGHPESLLLLRHSAAGQPPDEFPIATAPSFSCGRLIDGAFVPREGGGWALVNGAGCVVSLDAGFRRTDPVGLWEHLRRRGSIGIDWDEKGNIAAFLWVVVGLPVSLALGWLIGLALGRRQGRPLGLPGAQAGVALYLLSGGWLLLGLLPMLR